MTLKRTGFAGGKLLLITGLVLSLISCGGGGTNGSGGGGGGGEYDYSVSLAPDKTTVAPGGTVNLNLHYDAPASNAGIGWKLICVQSDCGSVSSAGVYTAPAKVDAQMVVGIKATSNDNPSKGNYVEIWVTGKIVVHIMPNNVATIHVSETIQFTSQVNSPDTAVAWQVNGATGGNSAVGTISPSGLYTAPPAVPNSDTVAITAVAHVDQTASTSVQLQILPPPQVSVAVSPRDQSVNINATLQFAATVQNTNDSAVTWQVNNIDGGKSTIGTISAEGLFTAPDAVPSPATETITAVSHADATKSGTTHVTIVDLKNALLKGPYSFEISGPDSTGAMRAAIGYLNFDGNGNFAAMLDLNFSTLTAGAETAVQYSGTYAVGQDNRGKMTFTFSPALTFVFTLNDTANDAKLIEFDTRGTHYVGSMQKQTPTDFDISKLAGDYAFSLYGVTMNGTAQVAIGRFHSDGAGNLSGGEVDSEEALQSPLHLTNLTGSASVSDPTRGRGTLTLSEPGTVLAHFSFYMTSAGDIYLLSTDPVPSDNPLLVGRVLSQSGGPFSNASLNGPSVFGNWGQTFNDLTSSCLEVGQWSATASTNSLIGIYDQICTAIVSPGVPLTATYSIAANGRGTFSNNSLPVDVFYMIAKNKAFLMWSGDTIGMAEPQQITTFNNSLLSGKYRIGPVSMPKPGSDTSQGYLVSDGNGNLTGMEDVFGQNLISFTLTGDYTVDSSGRTLVTFTSPETFHYVAYPVSTARLIGMSIETGDNQPNLISLDQ